MTSRGDLVIMMNLDRHFYRLTPSFGGISAAELVLPPSPRGSAAEATRDDFTNPRREICRVMRN
jgi:hypothetical protein